MLESLSNIPFPRGAGLVTRCPTELKMKKTAPGSPWTCKMSIQVKGEQITKDDVSISEIEEVIKEFSNLLCGKGLSSDVISVEVTSPNVPDLTLIDLPGIVRTATAGQHTAVIEQINALIDQYIQQPRTIILAVIPANVDIATVDILERALKHDPRGDRTVGVITKPDLVDRGAEEEVLDVLRNVRKPLKLGYNMVKNRSQQEIKDGTTLEQAHLSEQAFFATKDKFTDLYRQCPALFGVANLTKRLMLVLSNRIQQQLPSIKREVESKLVKAKADLSGMGDEPPQNINEALLRYMTVVNDVVRNIRGSVKGEYAVSDIFIEDESFRIAMRVRDELKERV